MRRGRGQAHAASAAQFVRARSSARCGVVCGKRGSRRHQGHRRRGSALAICVFDSMPGFVHQRLIGRGNPKLLIASEKKVEGCKKNQAGRHNKEGVEAAVSWMSAKRCLPSPLCTPLLGSGRRPRATRMWGALWGSLGSAPARSQPSRGGQAAALQRLQAAAAGARRCCGGCKAHEQSLLVHQRVLV